MNHQRDKSVQNWVLSKAPFTNQIFEDFNHPDAVDIERLTEDYDHAVHNGKYDVIVMEC